ncbi:hypothetical protein GCM10028818_59370 [Spirosoma horti]
MLDGLKGKQIKDAGKSRFNTKKLEDNTGKKETKPKGGGFFSFFKKKSSVVEKGQHMHDIANRRNSVNAREVKSIRDIASGIQKFIPADKFDEEAILVNRLVQGETPTTLDQLEAFCETANALYAFVDYKLTDESEEGLAYANSLGVWRSELKDAIYTLRDNLIQQEEGSLLRFGIENQFRKLHPDSPVPSLITERQEQLGVIVFGNTAPNDCGVFAGRLLGELEAATMKSLWTEIKAGNLTDDQIRDAFKQIIESGPSKDMLKYKSDPNFAYGHHAKTSIGASNGKVYSYEAHVGKPFILAPELREFDSMNDYLEMNDTYVDHRSKAGPATDYGGRDLAKTDIVTIKEWIRLASLKEPQMYLGQK